MSNIRVIGKGITSCAVKPSLPCKDDATVGGVSSVGKVMLDSDAKEEIALMEKIKKIDPAHIFTLQGVQSCIPKKDAVAIRKAFREQGCSPSRFRKSPKEAKLRQLILPYGGIPLALLSTEELIESLKRISNNDPAHAIALLFTEITRLIYSAKRLRELNMSHCDLHAGNILYNPATGRFTVIDFGFLQTGKTVASFLLGLRGYETNPVPQHPTEMALFVLLANQNRTLRALPILGGDAPESILEAIEEGARGRSETQLRKELAFLPADAPYRSLSKAMLPENVPGGDVMFRDRCRAIVGMREMTEDAPSTLDKTIKAFRFAIETIDSFGIGNIIKTTLTKIDLGYPELREASSHAKLLRIFRVIAEKMSHPDPTERISADKSLEILTPLQKTVGEDPRGNNERRFIQ